MKMLFKRFALCALVLVMLLPLTACHGSRGLPEFEIPETLDEDRNFEISFWAKNDTNKTQVSIYQKAISDFQALYPNIKVNLRLYTDYSRIYNDVITNIATQTTPNVCISYPDHIATYLSGTNVVAPLDGLFADEKYGLGGKELLYESPTMEEMIPKFLDECIVNGQHYAIPYMRSTEACYVNRDFVEKLGYELPEALTWDFVWEVAEAAMAKDENGNFKLNGQKVMIPFIYKSTDNMMIQMLYQLGAPYSNAEGEALIFNEHTRDILSTVASHAATGAFSTFKISSYPANFLNAGQCIFAVDSTAGATWMGSYAPLSDISEDKFVDFETVVMPIPQFDTQNPRMISQGPSVCVFNKADPQEVLASWLFAQFLLTDEVQIAYSQTEGYAPVTEKARQNEAYIDYMARAGEDNELYYDVKLAASRLLLENTDNTFVTPVYNGSASLRDAAGQLIENTTKSVRRGETVDNAYLDKLFDSVTSLYRLDQSGAAQSVGKAELGPLPTASKTLLLSLAGCWLAIGAYGLITLIKKRGKKP